MWLRLLCVGTVLAFSSLRTSAESLYLTTSERIEKLGGGDRYTFIAPYITSVQPGFSVSITKVTSTASSASDSKAAAPSITHAVYNDAKKEIVYSVSCDLTSVLHTDPVQPGGIDVFTVESAKPAEFGGSNAVTDVSADTVTVKAGKAPVGSYQSGTVTGTFCPTSNSGNSFSLVFSVTAIPTSRAYLYLSRNAFFSDSINVGLDNNGLLSSSDSSSVQQITAIITELAQTAAAFNPLGPALDFRVGQQKAATPRQRCFGAIANQLKQGPFYAVPEKADMDRMARKQPWTIHFDPELDPGVTLEFGLQPVRTSAGLAHLTGTKILAVNGQETKISGHDGLVAFFPIPALVTSSCSVVVSEDKGKPVVKRVYLNAPSIVNLYGESQFMDPQRDFLTNPQDTLTFNAGFIIGHKYTGQSSAKTIVDTVTAPIRAILPSVSVQQTTSVQSNGQTTNSTQTTTGPPKSQ